MKECLLCKKEFLPRKSEANRGYGEFCSQACSSKYNGSKRIIMQAPNEKMCLVR